MMVWFNDTQFHLSFYLSFISQSFSSSAIRKAFPIKMNAFMWKVFFNIKSSFSNEMDNTNRNGKTQKTRALVKLEESICCFKASGAQKNVWTLRKHFELELSYLWFFHHEKRKFHKRKVFPLPLSLFLKKKKPAQQALHIVFSPVHSSVIYDDDHPYVGASARKQQTTTTTGGEYFPIQETQKCSSVLSAFAFNVYFSWNNFPSCFQGKHRNFG